MGYSCTCDADNMLGLIRHTFTDGVTSNGLKIAGRSYFYEIGRENNDGRITGTIWLNTDENTARKVGGFCISPLGVISRFPLLTAGQRTALQIKFVHLLETDPQLLSSYSHGAI